MEISKTAVVIVAAACLTAGAAGGLVLSRPTPTAAPLTPQELDVEQSEAIVAEPPPRAAVTPSPAPPRRPVRRKEASPAPPPPPSPAPAIEPPVSAPATDTPLEIVPIAPAPIESARSNDPLPGLVEPALPELEELVIAGDSVIGLQIDTAVSSETARLEDKVVAHVTRDVKVGDKVAVPAGAKAQGEVTLVERGGKMRERARLGVRFTSIVLADGTTLPITTETIYREGQSPTRESATKIGAGAIAGTINGGLHGGGKGAAIGGAIGGGAGSAAVLAGGRNPATISAGSPVTVRLQEPATVTVER
jgi:hypothetical protein